MRYQIRDWPTASAEDNRFTAFFNGGYQLRQVRLGLIQIDSFHEAILPD